MVELVNRESIPIISFIVPTNRGHHTLEACLKSIKAQEGIGASDIFVVENGKCHVRVREICNSFSDVKYCYCPIKGRSEARNYLLNEIRSGYVAFVDDDVELASDWSKEALKSFRSPFIAACGGEVIKEGKKDWFQHFRVQLSLSKNRNTFNSLETSTGLPSLNTAAVMMRVSVLKEVGGFDNKFKRCEDTELSVRLYKFGYAL